MSQRPLYAFNRGLVSKLALARLDLNRLALAAEVMVNWMARKLGSMSLRPGLGYLETEPSKTKNLPFVFSADDLALVELHESTVSFLLNDERVARDAVTAAIVNGTFALNLAGWTQGGGGVATWVAGGGVRVVGVAPSDQGLFQSVAVVEPGDRHGIRFVVRSGVVGFGIVQGATTFFDEKLGPGTYSIGFAPAAGNFTVAFYSFSNIPAVVDSVTMEAGGDVLLDTPWAADDLANVRFVQSGDVLFLADGAHQQRVISRYNEDSWAISLYAPIDGPFRVENVTSATISASAITGDIALVASEDTFKAGHVGALFRLTSVGQTVISNFNGANQFGNSIRVTGVGAARQFTVSISGVFTATVTLQYSADDVTWYDYAGGSYTAPVGVPITDGLDNQIIYYRLGVKTGDYTSGTATASLIYGAGSITGTVRIAAVTDKRNASASVLIDLGGTAATDVWAEGEWSDYRGWPSAVALHDGRLLWAGVGKFIASVTDDYDGFDPDYVGDAGPINRSIGFGPVDSIKWLLSMDRLIAGTPQSEITVRSSTIDEPLTATNFTPKESSTQGTANVQALKIDEKALMIQRSAQRLYELAATGSGGNFQPEDLTALVPELLFPGALGMAVQRQPDTRVHVWRSDGTVAVLVFDKAENLICWLNVETDGAVEDVCVLPGEEEDSVYYVVRRSVGGVDVRYLEKWAMETEARGGAVNKIADSFVFQADAATTITDLGHLEGREVVAWGGGRDLGTYTVTGAQITLDVDAPVTNRCAGLTYSADWMSSKLATQLKNGSMTLTTKKKIHHLGLLLAYTHANGLLFGPTFDSLDPLPQVEQYAEVGADEVREMYEEPGIEFPGEWMTDARLCLRATAPRPCTVVAAMVEMETSGK